MSSCDVPDVTGIQPAEREPAKTVEVFFYVCVFPRTLLSFFFFGIRKEKTVCLKVSKRLGCQN